MRGTAKENEVAWFSAAGRTAVSVIAYPFDYAKFLTQIGYEPIPPWPTTTLFGKPALGLPNLFQYICYIKRVDGFYGCYRGLTPKLWAYCIYHIVYEKYLESKKIENEENKEDEEDDFSYTYEYEPIDDLDDEKRNKKYFEDFVNNLMGRTLGIIITHPLDVVWVRMMAQFVGRETKYVTIVGSIKEIYRTNWLYGFYAGFTPRFLAQALTLAMVSLSTYFINKYVIKDRDLRSLTYATMTFLASTVTYPFLLVAQCMAINDSGLIAGQPPMMPIYKNWMDCWSHLASIKQLKRGSSLLWRTISLPTAEAMNNNFIHSKIL